MKKQCLAAAFIMLAGAAQAEISVALQGGWDGQKVPAGQQCTLHGGNGATPPMKVSGLPAGTAAVLVEYDDKSYSKLATKGGHGTLLYPAKAGTVTLPSVPGLTDQLPGGVRVHKKARGTGKYASKGYMPPCSGGKGNRYTATLYPIGADGKKMDKVLVEIGRY
ncbi:hypothetical protein ACRARG_06195 [Pseudooceanicola sp. C21-150M6]|uniref:hypothetical protein n=1 Tax=Pseudooceanicola sp. C21-150M6 TaxID=3434355 RepID=UPI003D7FA35F